MMPPPSLSYHHRNFSKYRYSALVHFAKIPAEVCSTCLTKTPPNGNTIVAYEKVNDPLAKWQQCAFGHKRALETMKIFSYAALHPKSSLRDEKTFDVIFIPLKRATSWSTSLRWVGHKIN